MTRQTISTGSSANDGTGDTLRQAAQKINENFVEIYQKFGDSDNLSQIVSFVANGIEFNLGTTYTLTASAPPSTNQVVLLPDATGTFILDSAEQTLTNKTLTAPTISSPVISGNIIDTNDNEIIRLNPISSAVNEISISNATTGNGPTITTTGSNANINLNLFAKGAGSVEIEKAAFSTVEVTANSAVPATVTHISCNKATALALTLADGTTAGEYKIFTNKGAGTATVTPASFAQGTSFAIAQNAAAQAIWDGSNWFLISLDDDVTVS